MKNALVCSLAATLLMGSLAQAQIRTVRVVDPSEIFNSSLECLKANKEITPQAPGNRDFMQFDASSANGTSSDLVIVTREGAYRINMSDLPQTEKRPADYKLPPQYGVVKITGVKGLKAPLYLSYFAFYDVGADGKNILSGNGFISEAEFIHMKATIPSVVDKGEFTPKEFSLDPSFPTFVAEQITKSIETVETLRNNNVLGAGYTDEGVLGRSFSKVIDSCSKVPSLEVESVLQQKSGSQKPAPASDKDAPAPMRNIRYIRI